LAPSYFSQRAVFASPLSAFFISTFIGCLLQKPSTSAMPYAGWFHCRDVTRHGLTSDIRSTQIYSQNLYASS